jgi:Co/Zn/Cd efflux system component/copper chaperone CopZ
MTRSAPSVSRYRVVGIDCAHDAAAVEKAVGSIPDVSSVRVSAATHVMDVEHESGAVTQAQLDTAVRQVGYTLEPLASADESPRQSTIPPGYKRALWVVIGLNVGFGVVEMVGGVLSGSQSLKADALDFLGDGLITFVGLLATGWSFAWRARSALIQGVFLGVLGVSVLVHTAYRVLLRLQPEPEVMGVLGLIALVVNIAAAVALLPHRTGDANARAIWKFSRNDAIGNAAVVVAAVLVAWTRSPWPDLVVAFVIAALFLQSSWSIVRDARQDLREAVSSGR